MVSTRGGTITSNDPTPTTSPAKSSPAKSSPSKAKKLPVRNKDDGEDEAKAKPVKQAPAKSNSSNMVVFGDDDAQVDAQITKAKAVSAAQKKKQEQQQKVQEQEEDDEDSDAAPEAVSTSQAASAAKQSLKASQKAAQEKLATQKRKRQERDTLLKQQAAERKKTAVADADSDEAASKPVPAGRVRGEKIDLPSVLPAEFLTDSSSEDEDEAVASAVAKSKRRKVAAVENTLTRLDKGPRDVAVGSTVYRVASKVDERLAPKAKKHAKGSKAALLQRSRPVVKSRTSGSFFTKK